MTQSKLRTLLNQLDRQNTDYSDDDAQVRSSLAGETRGQAHTARTALALIRSLDKDQLAQLQLLLARAEGELDD